MTYKKKLLKRSRPFPKHFMPTSDLSRKLKETISYLIKEDGSVIENNENIATALGQFFETKFNKETLDHIPELPERTTSRLFYVIITEQLMLSGLFCLNSN